MAEFSTTNTSQLMSDLKQQHYAHYLWVMLAPPKIREDLLAILALDLELALIPSKVSEEMLGHIRFTWWQEAFDELEQGKVREHPLLQLWYSQNTPPACGGGKGGEPSDQPIDGSTSDSMPPLPTASQSPSPPQAGWIEVATNLITTHREHYEQHPDVDVVHALEVSNSLVYELASKLISQADPTALTKWQRKVKIIQEFQEQGKLKPSSPWLMVRLLF